MESPKSSQTESDWTCCKAEAPRSQSAGRVRLGMVRTPVVPRFSLRFASVSLPSTADLSSHQLLIYLASYLTMFWWRQNCHVAFGRIGRPPKTSILGSFSNPRSGAVYVWILPCGLRKLYAPSPPFGRLISSWLRSLLIIRLLDN